MNPRNKRLLFLLPVLAVAAWLAVFGDKTPVDQVVEPSAPVAVGGDVPVERAPAAPVASGELPRVAAREQLPARIDSPDARDLFAALAPVAPPPQDAPTAQEPQEAAPPELPFAFIGRELYRSQWRYFLEKDGQVYVLAPGQQADGFRLETTRAGELVMVDLATRARHIIPLEGE